MTHVFDSIKRVAASLALIFAAVSVIGGLGCTARSVPPEVQYDVERVDSLRSDLDEMAK